MNVLKNVTLLNRYLKLNLFLFQITKRVYEIIEMAMKANDETTLGQLQTILQSENLNISKATIDRARRELGFTFKGMF